MIDTSDISGSETFYKIEPIMKGWSGDQKYFVETTDNRRLLLRVSSMSQYESRKADYSKLLCAYTMNIPTPAPIEFGVCNQGENCYLLQEWLSGTDLATVLPQISISEQYILGRKAGEVLRKIHSIEFPINPQPWFIRFAPHVHTWVNKYRGNSAVHSDIGEMIIHYLESHHNVLDSRPQTFTHGDYGLENIILRPDNTLSIIDFRCTDTPVGDPWWDMNSMVWVNPFPTHFYSGQINGYFEGDPPKEFWDTFAYYLAYDALAALSEPDELNGIDNGLQITQSILEWTSEFRIPKVTWYLQNNES